MGLYSRRILVLVAAGAGLCGAGCALYPVRQHGTRGQFLIDVDSEVQVAIVPRSIVAWNTAQFPDNRVPGDRGRKVAAGRYKAGPDGQRVGEDGVRQVSVAIVAVVDAVGDIVPRPGGALPQRLFQV